MPTYSVEDTKTGKSITFDWEGKQPPQEADLEEIFSAAYGEAPKPKPQPQPEAPIEKISSTPYVSDVAQGFLGSAGSAMQGLGWLTSSEGARTIGDQISEYSKKFGAEDPGLGNQLAAGYGSAGFFFLPGIGISYATAPLGPIGNLLGIATSTVLESASEAGEVYKAMLDKGMSEVEANDAATKTFLANAALVGITNKLGVFSGEGILRTGAVEGGQEAGQTMISDYFQGNPQSTEDIAISGIIGAIIGGTIGGASNINIESIKNITSEIKKKLRGGEPIESEISKLEAFFQNPSTEEGALTPPPLPTPAGATTAGTPPPLPAAPASVTVAQHKAVGTAPQEAPVPQHGTSKGKGKAKIIRKSGRGVVATIKPEEGKVTPTTPAEQIQQAESKPTDKLETLISNQDRMDNLIPDRRTDVATAEQIDLIHQKARDNGATSLTDEEILMYNKYTERKAIERTARLGAETNTVMTERKAKNKARLKETKDGKDTKAQPESRSETRPTPTEVASKTAAGVAASTAAVTETATEVKEEKKDTSDKKGEVKVSAKTEAGLLKVVSKLTKDVETLLEKKKLTEAERDKLDKLETKLMRHEDELYKLRPDLKPAEPDADAIVKALKPNKKKIDPAKIEKELRKVGLEIETIIEERSNISTNSPAYRELSQKLEMLSAYEVKLYENLGENPNDISALKEVLNSDEVEDVFSDRMERATADTSTSPEVIVKEAQETDSLNPDEIRKGTKAYRFADGYIITGNSFAEMTGQLMNELSNHGGRSEQGYIDAEGNFISETLLRKRNEPEGRKKSRLDALKLIAKLRDQRGLVGSDIGGMNNETIKRLAEVRAKFKVLEKEARKAGVEIEQYLRNSGMSEELIESYKSIKAYPIQGGEVIKHITLEQKKVMFEITEGSGLKIKDAIEKLGIDKDLDNLSFTEAEQVTAYLVEPETINDIMLKLTYQPVGIVSRINYKLGNLKDKTIRHWASPEIGFSKEKASAQFYKAADRVDINKHRMLAYIEESAELRLAEINKLVPEGSNAARNVALALENKIDMSKLTKKERMATEGYRKFYKWALDFYVKHKSASPAEEATLRQLAPTVKYNVKEDAKLMAVKLREIKKEYNISKEGMKALDLLRMAETYYLPHVFERAGLSQTAHEMLREMRERGSTNKEAMKALEKIASKNGGQLLYNAIPKSLMFKHLQKRHGVTGYKIDAHIALNSYVRGFLKEIYDAPLVQQYNILREQVSPDMQKHMDNYMKDYLGQTEHSQVAQFIRQMEWIRTLGFSIKSAIVNGVGGTLNTAVEGGHHTVRGYLRAITKEGRQEFHLTGLHQEVPQVMLDIDETAYYTKTEKLRHYAGWLFNKAELGLRNTAYHTGKAKGESLGLTGEDLYYYSMDFVHKTQYRYGKVGMPMGMRGWSGTLTQFASYPVKTFELMYHWLFKEGMAGKIKLLTFIMASEGGEWASREFLNLDLSSGLGFGTRLGDMLAALSAATRGEWEEATKDWKMSWGGGSGLLPEGMLPIGPAWNLINVFTQHSENRLNDLVKELSPLQAVRVKDFFYALKYAEDGRYPVFKYEGILNPVEKKYELNLKDTILKAFGPKPNALSEMQRNEYRNYLTEKEISSILVKFNRALVRGDSKEVERLFYQYPGVVATQKDIGRGAINESLKMTLTAEQRRQLRGIGSREIKKIYLDNK